MPSFYDTSDPNLPSQQYDQFPQGEIAVAGIHSFISVDDQGVPFYKERDGLPVVMIKLALADGSEGPPMSCGPADLALLVAAFAGPEAVALLPKDRGSVAYLLTAKILSRGEAPEQSSRPITPQKAYVGQKGYVRNVNGANPPTTMFFRLSVVEFRNLDGKTDPLEFQYKETWKQNIINLRLKIVGDMTGQPTIYDGAIHTVQMENPFGGTQEVTLENGTTTVVPKMKVNQNGSRPKSVARLYNFLKVFCPEIENHEWIADATRSPYGTNEAANPIVVIASYVKRNPRIGIGKFSQSQTSSRVSLDLMDLVPLDGTVPAGVPAPALSPKAALKALYATIRDYIPGVFVEDGTPFPAFSDSGVNWAKSKLLPVWTELALPEHHRMVELDEKQATDLLGRLLQTEDFRTRPIGSASPKVGDF